MNNSIWNFIVLDGGSVKCVIPRWSNYRGPTNAPNTQVLDDMLQAGLSQRLDLLLKNREETGVDWSTRWEKWYKYYRYSCLKNMSFMIALWASRDDKTIVPKEQDAWNAWKRKLSSNCMKSITSMFNSQVRFLSLSFRVLSQNGLRAASDTLDSQIATRILRWALG